jgi:hypothetical protein
MAVLEVAPPQEKVTAADLPPDPLLVVEVTQEDIDNGLPANGAHCPIARAMNRLGFRDVSVGSRNITWFDHQTGVYRMSLLPREAIRFVRAFDLGGFFSYHPFTFALQTGVQYEAPVEPWKGMFIKEGELLQWNYKVHQIAEKMSASP